MPERPLPFKISVLVFVRNTGGKLLLIRRNKSPNMGMWSPIGGKLEMSEGSRLTSAQLGKLARKSEWSLPNPTSECFL